MPVKSFLSFLSLSRPFFKLLLTNSFQHRLKPIQNISKHPSVSPIQENGFLILPSQTLIIDFEGWLLRSSCTFPYFIVVAFESCSILRALLLLIIYPIVCCLNSEAGLKLMVMVCFFGSRKEKFRVAGAVLSKLFMESVAEEGFKVLINGRRRVGVSKMPKIMVESFLKEYLDIDVVIGRELKEFCGFYTGLMERGQEEVMISSNGGDILGFGCYGEDHHNLFSYCKEVHRISESEKSMWHQLPRENFPKSLIFHDGRIAFLPAPAATLAMFIWLPFGATLSIFRHINGMFFPYYISFLIGALTGIVYRHSKPAAQTKVHEQVAIQPKPSCGRLYICNHRTLLDPLFISACLNKQVTAVVYSLSRVSEFLSPIKTARLTRNKEEDREKMKKLLEHGDLVICPEGTTCREPYLLRFSPLFAELADEITPVALTAEGTMFYGTTACGFKWLDSFYFLMNPRPKYVVQLLEEISVVLDNGKRHSPCEMANRVQREIGRCLGFKCTTLTRKDKYQMLAGNDGIVQEKHNA
ncbi:hypothetical protein KFK09_028361 [Dendrobium nobile]|uniref:Phospholipid/glycerol acyltransferase domain-containing protein n=1 Tax=Dendrobium nobile TaxID=94219 RepID=A0A8T3A2F2_DENNO|nr:hypothetical protein KFK09_028361 [Dendrobium nobile]